jgi:hypothetical protein
MPIVVDEVVISVEVTGGAPPATDAAKGSGADASRPASGMDTGAIVEECVERVLEVLARRKER